MRILYLFAFALLGAALQPVNAQTRYVDSSFAVSAATEVVYANNFDILRMANRDLMMDIYQPVGDTTTTERPMVVIWPTGSFLPQYFNGSPYGSRKDSVNVEIAKRLVQRGYVAAVAEYRVGWSPTADQDTRTGTLLRAVYRAGQDAHAAGRFLRKTVAEDNNPYNIDTSRLVYWGNGSGGYLALAHAFLDDIDEILTNPDFYDEDGVQLVSEEVNSNPQGTTTTAQNVVNHPGYMSDVALTVNMAGALGDTAWIDTTENEPGVIAYHSFTDPFAPFNAGLVQVPVPNGSLPVIDVLGSNTIIAIANGSGLNDAMAPANALQLPAPFSALSTAVNQRNAAYKNITRTSPIPGNTDDSFPLSRDNMYPILRNRGASPTAGIYNWFDETTLRAQITGINANVPGANINADAVVEGEDITNPNRNNPAEAKLFIDTMMAHFIPRAWYQLELADITVSTEDLLTNASVGLEIFPNPGTTGFTIRVANSERIRQIDVYDLRGSRVAQVKGIDQSSYVLDRGNLANGSYIIQLRFDEGTTARKVFLR
ncbi:hypothetical protein LEM8419_00330 [Neolewinella maritima]|uniref:T9SS type A sorting domain-containing protein n=1 Tax=Neolewinella maritima TaxID=1383882 RepID=A0ABM9AWZ3_9BACT|nr:T9SS type A sorting domain-containing protein [Neolewinella maritima]CAH0999035.1 hypothetical protein LEM8419_00330 [Neolewinella maritima]